jgi:transposase
MSVPPEVEALIAAQARAIERLRAEVAELRRRLDLDSTTSSKPPSSDGLKKKPRLPGSLRGRSGKASGGQRGHKGDTLRQVSDPDEIVEHQAERCAHCRARLDAAGRSRRRIEDTERRQVFDLPERLLRTTEHRAFVYRCASCGLRTKAEFAAGVISPTQYGERVRAAAVYLNVQQLLPEARTAQALSDLIGAQLICAASVTGWARDKAQTLEPVYRAIGMGVAEAKLRCLDDPSAMLRTAFASPARPNGCTRPRASAIRSTGSVARAATFPRGLRAGLWCTTTFAPTPPSTRSTTPSATPSSARTSGAHRHRQGGVGA